MAHDPAFYHQILRDVFKGENENETPDEPDDRAKARWRLSYSLFRHFSTIPGLTREEIDAQALRSWIDRVRELGRETDRIAVTDSCIGRLLAHSPSNSDGGWPHRCVRDEIERMQSLELERGAQVERYNMRGVYGKAVFEGGDKERDWRKSTGDTLRSPRLGPARRHCLRLLQTAGSAMLRGKTLKAYSQRKLRS